MNKKKLFIIFLATLILNSTTKTQLNLKLYYCPVYDDPCIYITTDKVSLLKHIMKDHIHLKRSAKEKKAKCIFCHKIITKRHLRIHIKSVHLKIKNNKCPYCKYMTTQKTNLNTHVERIHIKTKKLLCQYCQYGTNIKINLDKHIKLHHTNKSDESDESEHKSDQSEENRCSEDKKCFCIYCKCPVDAKSHNQSLFCYILPEGLLPEGKQLELTK